MKPLFAVLLAVLSAFGAACGDDTPSGGDAAPGAVCGGRANAPCPSDQYCDFANNRCGASDMTGTCVKRPTGCPALLVAERTCGCDTRVYSSPCEAQASGTDLNETGSCTLDPGAFGCGYRQCARTTEYCQRDGSDIAGVPDGYTCRGLPNGCGTSPSCSCIAGQPCGNTCTGDSASGLTLSCPGG